MTKNNIHEPEKSNINTGGGASVGNNVNTERDFIGRDFIQVTIKQLNKVQNKSVLLAGSMIAAALIIAAIIPVVIDALYNTQIPDTPIDVSIQSNSDLQHFSVIDGKDTPSNITDTVPILASVLPTLTPVSAEVTVVTVLTQLLESVETADDNLILITTPVTKSNYPCQAEVYSEQGSTIIRSLHSGPSSNSRLKRDSLVVGTVVTITEQAGGSEIMYNITDEAGIKGWLSLDYLLLSAQCPKN